jgi:hypothetical protein
MAQDDIKKKGTVKAYENDSGGATLFTGPVLGVVKNNIDPTRAGRIEVYIATHGGADPDDSKSWITVSYLSPFYGVAAPNNDPRNGPDKAGYGKFNGNPQSYGFWASAPDLGTEVVCIFIDGRPNQGYYIGCVPQAGLLSMTPAIGSTTNIIPNKEEASSYGGADRVPTSEINYSNPTLRNSPTINTDPKPIHSYQASILNQQGLIRDNIRGVISSSAIRETPSRVFGFSTPGGPIFEGGYTSSTIKAAAKTADTSKLQITGRTGGHSFVMDDGSLEGNDQLVRIRTSAGHQIMMNDSGQTLFIIHSNGQSWIELGKEGTIDMFSTNSVNIRTQGDLNLHADRDVNIHAKKNLGIFADNINVESDKNINVRAGVNFSGYTLGDYTFKVNGVMSMASTGDSSYLSNSITYINGNKINLNTGQSGTQPKEVPVITKISHIDTSFSEGKGWINPGPEALLSIANRVPTHQPWINSNKGVDVTVSSVAPSAAAQAPTAEVSAVNESTPAAPENATTPAIVDAVPPQPAAGGGQLDSATTTAMVAQQSVTNAAKSVTEKAASSIMPGVAGAKVAQLAAAGQLIKPGTAEFVGARLAQGVPVAQNLAGLVTGNNGATSPLAVVNNVSAQAGAISNSINNAAQSLTNSGVIKGTESAGQIAGIVQAAASFGAKAVGGVLAGTGVANGKAIADSIAGGKFASQLADKVKSGVSGLASSVAGFAKGVASGIGNTITNLAGSLQSTLKNAFAAVESSFKNMKAGLPNKLGGGDNVPSAANLASPSAILNSAEAEAETAQAATLNAIRTYRNNSSPENLAALNKAEADLSAAKQKLIGASNSFLSGSVPAITLPAAGLAATTLNSGVNALPGGASSMVSQVTGGLSKAVSGAAGGLTSAISGGLSNAISGATGGLTGGINNSISGATNSLNNLVGKANNPLADPSKLVGNLVKNASDAVGGALGKVKDLAGGATTAAAGILSKIQTSISSVGGSGGQIKAAVAAANTFDKTALVAKAGQLLGDPKIPAPVFNELPPDNADVNKVLAKVNTAYEEVSSARTALEIQQAKVEAILYSVNTGKVEYFSIADELNAETKTLQDLAAKLITAQTSYAVLVNSNE